MPSPDDRVTALERLRDQQLQLNDQLIRVTARLDEEQALHHQRLAEQQGRLVWQTEMLVRLDTALAQHRERMDRLDQLLQAIRDLLGRENGH